MTGALTLLEDIGKSHERMVELADQLDWNGVVDEWKSAYPKIVELKTMSLGQLSGRERAEAARQIAKLLEFEEQISEKITPWLDQARPLLEAFRKYPLKTEARESR